MMRLELMTFRLEGERTSTCATTALQKVGFEPTRTSPSELKSLALTTLPLLHIREFPHTNPYIWFFKLARE